MGFVDVASFVRAHLPAPPARILEIGCGAGELSRELATGGYDVTAIDPEAPDGPIFRRVTFEDLDDPGPFHAIVAALSLHHIHDLDAALAKVHDLLVEGGALVLDEFAWELMDLATARWWGRHAPDHVGDPSRFLEEWHTEHEGLHTSDALLDALRPRLAERVRYRLPYIARNYLERPELESEEQASIDAGEINALGFRLVGVRPEG